MSAHLPAALGVSALVLDANVLIAYLDAGDVSNVVATDLLVSNADAGFIVSAVNLAEVLVYPARADALDAARDALSLLDLTIVPLREDDVAALASLRADTDLKMPDVCALWAAQSAHARLATLDRRLAVAARGVGVEVVTR